MGLFCNSELLAKIKSFLELPIFSPVMTHNRQGGHFCLRYYQYVVLLVGWYDKLIWNLDKYIRQLMKIHLDKYFFQLGQMHFTKRTTNFCETKGCMWFELSDDTTSCYMLISNLDKYIWQLRKDTFSYLDKYVFVIFPNLIFIWICCWIRLQSFTFESKIGQFGFI